MPKYKPPRKPWSHQQEALDKMKGKRPFALHMGTRTGKTFTSLTDWARTVVELHQADDLLVIPPASYYEEWEHSLVKDLSKDFVQKIDTLVWRADSSTEEGNNEFLSSRKPRVLIIDAEAVAWVPRAQKLVLDFLEDRRCMTLIDESTTIKNPSAKAKLATFTAEEIGPRSAFRRTLSGLPTPRSPMDIYNQFRFLDPEILGGLSYTAFMYRYAIVKKRRFSTGTRREIVAYRNLDHLNKLIDPFSYQVELEANRNYERISVELTKEQRRLYDDLKKYAHTSLGKEERVTVDMVLTQVLRLHQIVCGHVKTDSGETVDIPENRTRQLIELAGSSKDKLVIWTMFDPDVRKLTVELEKKFGQGTVSRFWGGNRKTRLEEEDRFLNESKRRFMIATPAAARFGREWKIASQAAYYTNSDNLEHRVQSEARILAFDKDDWSVYYDFVAPGTVEVKIIQSLIKKNSLASQVDGRKWREWLE